MENNIVTRFFQTSVSPSALQAPPYYLGRGKNQMPALELPLQLLLLLLRLRELGLLLALLLEKGNK